MTTVLADYLTPFNVETETYYSQPHIVVYKTEETLDCIEAFPQKLCVCGHTLEGLKVVYCENDEEVFAISEENLVKLYQAPGKLMISFDSSSPSPNSRVKPGSPAHVAAFSLSPVKCSTTSEFDLEY